MTLDRAKRRATAAKITQMHARSALEARDQAIRAAVAEHGIRPTARALGMDPALIHRIAHREEQS